MTGTGALILKPMAYERIADLYDSYVTADFDIPFLVQAAKQTAGPVLELMSGTGRVSMPLAEAGVQLTCVDSSPAMLAHLREKLEARRLHAAVHCMDVRELALPDKYDLILIPFHSFSELICPADQRAVLARVRYCLTEAGRFICTLPNQPAKLKTIDGQLRLWGKHHLKESGETLLFWGLQQQGRDPSVVEGVQLYEQYDDSGLLRAKRMIELRYYLHSHEGFRELVETAGFTVEREYGDYQGQDYDETTSPFMITVLRSRTL